MVAFFRLLLNFLLLLGILSGCSHHTCPTYLSTYQYNINAKPHKFFAYFDSQEEGGNAQGSENSGLTAPVFADMVDDTEALRAAVTVEDTVMNEHGLLIFPEGEEPSNLSLARTSNRNRNGIMRKKKYALGFPLFKRKPKRTDNFPRSVDMTNPRPFKTEEAETEGDSTQTEGEGEHALVQVAEDTVITFEQYYYELRFGKPGAQDSTSAEAEEGETAEEGEGPPPDETKKERRKRLRKERKEARRKKKEEKRLRKAGKLPPKKEGENGEEEQPIGEENPPERGTDTAKADDF